MSALLTVLFYFVIIAILAIVGVVVLVTITTGWVKSGRLSGGLYCLTAPPSNGKSFVATSLAIQFMRQGRRVFTNFPIVYRNGREKYTSRFLEKDMLLTKNLNGSVIIIDEAYRWFWSREFKEFSKEYALFFSTLAQHGISLYYVVQHEDRVDTIINDCANLFGEISKFEIPIIEMPMYFEIFWYNREIEMQMSRTNKNIEPYHSEKIWFDKDTAHAYDTCWFGKDPRPEYEGIDWIQHLQNLGVQYVNTEHKHSVKNIMLNAICYKFYYPLLTYIAKIKNFIREKILIHITPHIQTMKKKVMEGLREIGSRFDKDREKEDEEQKNDGDEKDNDN